MNFRHLAYPHKAKTPEFTPFQNLPTTNKKEFKFIKNSNQTLKFCHTDKVLVILVKLSYRLVLSCRLIFIILTFLLLYWAQRSIHLQNFVYGNEQM